jgi:hypothetical protein
MIGSQIGEVTKMQKKSSERFHNGISRPWPFLQAADKLSGFFETISVKILIGVWRLRD